MRFEVRGHDNGAPGLRALLDVLGERALVSRWTVRHGHEEFWATGQSSKALEAGAAEEASIEGARMLALADATAQVIWGVFEGRMPAAGAPWIVIEAFDGAMWVEASEETWASLAREGIRRVER